MNVHQTTPFRDFERLAGALLGTRSNLRTMPIDLRREGDAYVLQADLPGVDTESLDVDLDGQLLTLRAERRTRVSGTDGGWIVREREHGSYVRQLNLGQGIDVEGIAASFDDGVLTVTLPLSPKARARKIVVAGGRPGTATEEDLGSTADAQTPAEALIRS